MSKVNMDEIERGLIVHLDPKVLAGGGSEATVKTGHAVKDPHYFLVLSVDSNESNCIAMPLFSESGRDRELLDENLKSGCPKNWKGQASYIFRWQVWRIPLTSIEAASGADESEATTRRGYAKNDQEKLDKILDFLKNNNQEFTPV